MKFSEKWLREYIDPALSTQELCDRLTLAGLEVDAIEPVAGEFSKIVVGEIKEIVAHPNADKLRICQVDVNADERLNIVCGAPNIYVGMKAPVALIGAVLPGDFKIKKSKLRGEPSFGMMCSEKELGLSEGHGGLMDLPSDASVGTCIREYLDLDDSIIDVDLTPNRADCLSVYGVAREVAALTNAALIEKSISVESIVLNESLPVSIQASTDCKRYLGRIIKNINTKAASPLWLKEKLRRSGVRSISVVVDVTNFVLLEFGQPMHAFDLDRLDHEIIVRKAHKDEKLVLLDETELTLDDKDLVIADASKALALAGIMGGQKSSVTDDTKHIFLESAYFCPIAIAGKARKYGLHTDSSHRFERGVDPQLATLAMDRATEILVSIAGGDVGPITEVTLDNVTKQKNAITLRAKKVNSVLGCDFSNDYIQSVLEGLGLEVTKISEGKWTVVAPTYRFDINIEEDLIEEVGRIYGYENLPENLPTLDMKKPIISDKTLSINSAKNSFVQRDYHEVINYSFIDPKFDEYFFKGGGITLSNPIASDMAVMRQSLIPGLLTAFKANLNRQQERVRIFEEGVTFELVDGQKKETVKFAGLAFGKVTPLNWGATAVTDFYSVKADVEAILSQTGLTYMWEAVVDCDYLHPGKSASILCDDQVIGTIGVLHPDTMKFMQIKGTAPVVFELLWSKISTAILPVFKALSKYPSISRDLAVIVDADVVCDALLTSVRESAGHLLQDVRVFDVYQGDNLPKNKKSIALNLILQDSSQTLNEDTINLVVTNVLNHIEEQTGATLRE